MTGPALRWTSAPATPDAVVLVLHGGRVQGTDPVRWTQPPVLRMLPVAWAVRHAGRGRLAVVRLRYAVRGWNGTGAPLADARWALEQVRARHPGRPIALLGHSMGGRVALHLAADADVVAIVTLAAWLEEGDDVRARPGLRALLLHGDEDEVTDPRGSEVAARELERQGARVLHVVVPGEAHPMLRRPRYWHAVSSRFLRRALLGGS